MLSKIKEKKQCLELVKSKRDDKVDKQVFIERLSRINDISSLKTRESAVIAVDIIGFTKLNRKEQIFCVNTLEKSIISILNNEIQNDEFSVVIIPTGDGMAIILLSEKVAALSTGGAKRILRLAVQIQSSLSVYGATDNDPLMRFFHDHEREYMLRLGISLAEIDSMRLDINCYPNLIDDSINIAFRVMGKSQPGGIALHRKNLPAWGGIRRYFYNSNNSYRIKELDYQILFYTGGLDKTADKLINTTKPNQTPSDVSERYIICVRHEYYDSDRLNDNELEEINNIEKIIYEFYQYFDSDDINSCRKLLKNIDSSSIFEKILFHHLINIKNKILNGDNPRSAINKAKDEMEPIIMNILISTKNYYIVKFCLDFKQLLDGKKINNPDNFLKSFRKFA